MANPAAPAPVAPLAPASAFVPDRSCNAGQAVDILDEHVAAASLVRMRSVSSTGTMVGEVRMSEQQKICIGDSTLNMNTMWFCRLLQADDKLSQAEDKQARMYGNVVSAMCLSTVRVCLQAGAKRPRTARVLSLVPAAEGHADIAEAADARRRARRRLHLAPAVRA